MTNPTIDSTISDFLRGQELFGVAGRALQQTGATGIAIALKHGDDFVCCATAGETVPTLGVQLQKETGITGACIRSGQTEICHDASSDHRVNAAACEQLKIASVIAVPIVYRGAVIGVLEALSREPYTFGPSEQIALEALAREVQPGRSAELFAIAEMADERLADSSLAGHEFSLLPATIPVIEDVAIPLREDQAPHLENEPVAFHIDPPPQDRGSLARSVAVAVLYVCAVVTLTVYFARSTARTNHQDSAPPSLSSSLPSPPPQPSSNASGGTTSLPAKPSAPTPPADSNNLAVLEAAATAGNPSSQLKLATVLAQGTSGPKDLVSAYAWYTVARMSGKDDPTKFLPSLSQRLSSAQMAQVRVKLAEMFWKGSGVKQDSVEAYSWLVLADAAGAPDVAAYQERLALEMNDAQIAEAQQRAQTWLKQHRRSSVQH